MALGLTQPLT